jgi:hypothetical protein
VPTGQTYTISVFSARYNYTPRTINVTQSANDVNFEGMPLQ